MKVKYTGETTKLRTKGKTYEARELKSGQYISFIADDGEEGTWDKDDDFKIIPEDPIEEKKKQISDAQNLLTKLQKELSELTTPKVGNKYETCNCKYVLAEIEGKFVLVCYDGYHCGNFYYGPVDTIKEAFCGHEHYFTKLD